MALYVRYSRICTVFSFNEAVLIKYVADNNKNNIPKVRNTLHSTSLT
jgi:hypothetical protein